MSRYRERGSRRPSLVKARGSKLGAERQENLERGSVRGSALREGRLTSAIDALRIIHDGKQGFMKILIFPTSFKYRWFLLKNTFCHLLKDSRKNYHIWNTELPSCDQLTLRVSLIPAWRGLNTARRKEQHNICLYAPFMLFYEYNKHLAEGSLTLHWGFKLQWSWGTAWALAVKNSGLGGNAEIQEQCRHG